jgi:fructose-1,6-bisphosphatase/inositol monophosphatase family enzyme
VAHVHDDDLLAVLRQTADAVGEAFRTGVVDYRAGGERDDQYALDLVTDAVAVKVLVDAGLGVLSEESGVHHPDRDITIVVDPIDGSTNASRGIPWFATSLAAVDPDGLRAGLVLNQSSGVRYEAVRGGGATRDGQPIRVAAPAALAHSIVATNGLAPRHLGWEQFRALGSAALDLCLVAEGTLDGYLDCAPSAHGAWDYLGAMCVLIEAGGVITDAFDRPLTVLDHEARRAPVASSSPELLAELLAHRRTFGDGPTP